MNAIEETISRLKKIKKSAKTEAENIVKSNPNLLSDLNRQQLSKGEKADGSDMPLYVPDSKAPKAPGKIKLFDKGSYTKEIKPLFSGVGVDMTSTDRKKRFLDPKYPLALGLSDPSILIIQEKVKKELPNRLLKL